MALQGAGTSWRSSSAGKDEGPDFHLALAAPNRRAVDKIPSSRRGRENGAPGLRVHYGPNYYAAFVIAGMKIQ